MVQKSNKRFVDVVRSSSVPKRPVFLHLRYPDNYHVNFDDFVSIPKKISGVISHDPKIFHSKNHNPPARPKRVLRWVQKVKSSKPALSQEEFATDLNKAPFQGQSILRNTKAMSPNSAFKAQAPIWTSPTSNEGSYMFQVFGPRPLQEGLHSICQVQSMLQL